MKQTSRKKIASLFTLSLTVMVLLTSFSLLFILNSIIDTQAYNVLKDSLGIVSQDFVEGEIIDKEISFQRSNSYSESKSDNIKLKDENEFVSDEPLDLEALKDIKSSYSQVISPNGDVPLTSDLFKSVNLPADALGFNKIESGDTCVYILSQKLETGELAGSVVRVGQFCSITPEQSQRIVLGVFAISAIILIVAYFLGLKVADWLLKPYEQAVKDTKNTVDAAYHELLTPVTVALSTVERAQMTGKYKDGIESLKEDLTGIYESLEYVKHGTAKKYKEIDPHLELQKALRLFEKDFNSKSVKVELEIEKGVKVSAETSALAMIYRNLLQNAAKYAKPNSVLNISISPKSFFITNEFENDGTLEIKRVFESGYRGCRTECEGKGIGLTLVKDIVSELGWSIIAENENCYFKITIHWN